MLSTPVKRSAPHSEDSRPYKRIATSSPEEGELDDGSPPNRPPTPPRVHKPATVVKVPFPFKTKGNASDPVLEAGSSNGRSQTGVTSRQVDEARKPESSWPLPPRPQASDSRGGAQRNSDYWSRRDGGPAPRSRIDESDRHYEPDRHYHSRTDREHWEPKHSRSQSPRRYTRRLSSRSRSRSTPRSRSPLSPESTGREKHRLPPPRSPLAVALPSYSRGYRDERDQDHRRSDSRDRRHRGDSRSGWDDDSYVADDGHRGQSSRSRWRRGDAYSRRSDDERDQDIRHNGDSYRPMSPRSSRRPISPRSPPGRAHRSPERFRNTTPPPPDLAPPPSPPHQPPTSNLPSHHVTVKIPLPKKLPTPPKRSPHRPLNLEGVTAEKPKENGQPRATVRRERRKPVVWSRNDDYRAYGRTFEGCGLKDNYDIINKLGEGTFGEVHKARHHRGALVALKRILMHNEKEGMPVTALREIKILKALHHPCIVDIVDMFVVKSRGKESPLSVYMVFPYMDHDLAGLLENERVKLSPSQIKLYMKQLLEGTEYMHRNHILHRDMKAANLLISNTGCLKIADFGLARAYDPNIVKGGDDLRGRERKYTNCVVTRWYRPPELLLGARQYGGEVDMWGIGCVLGEMFWRKPILPGSSDLDQLDKIWQLCGTPNQHTWPNYDLLPGCEGVKRFTSYPRRLKQTYDTIGVETCDLLDKLLTCNPRERLTASQALDHDYFWTDPLPADPKTLPTYEASHEFDKRGRRHQPAGPPVQLMHVEPPSRPIPQPTQPPTARSRPPPPPGPPYGMHNYPPAPPGTVLPPLAPAPRPKAAPQQLPPLVLRPGEGLPPQWQQPINLPLPPRPGHLPQRPGARSGGREPRENRGDHRGRRGGVDGSGGNGALNYG
ncbi:Pkinase-domain-containing protein [Cristinia sonorae]|uniref:Pkinase-domain-containing protein n=1 Tax=Cristinia sonorae TaxID=1940300 RepID=A0A8K0USB0_9AGAR|nr:Pkinase-domain-containing protein [Cristinia sonorae]